MDSTGLAAALLIIGSVLVYLLPAIIAGNRNHKNGPAIFVLNLFLGWTFLGWVIALVWSFTDNTVQASSKEPIYDETGEIRAEKEQSRHEPTLR